MDLWAFMYQKGIAKVSLRVSLWDWQECGKKGTILSSACKHEWTNCISRYCKVSLLVVHHIAFHGLEPLSIQKSASQEDSYTNTFAGFSPGSIAVGSGSIVCSVSADSSVGRALISCTTACISASDLTDSDATYAASCSCSSVFWFVPKQGQLRERDIMTVSIEESSSMKVLKYRKFAMPPRTVLCYTLLERSSSGKQGATAGAKEGARAVLSFFWVWWSGEVYRNVSWRHQKKPCTIERWKWMEKDETSTISMIWLHFLNLHLENVFHKNDKSSPISSNKQHPTINHYPSPFCQGLHFNSCHQHSFPACL